MANDEQKGREGGGLSRREVQILEKLADIALGGGRTIDWEERLDVVTPAAEISGKKKKKKRAAAAAADDDGSGDDDKEEIDVDDELVREAKFSADALDNYIRGISQVAAPYKRPADYYAEMLKSDDHMLQVRRALVAQRTRIERAQARRNRKEQKVLGKKTAAIQRREKQEAGRHGKEEVAKWVSREVGAAAGKMSARSSGVKKKRAAKNAKYGSGGRKRGLKRNDRTSFLAVPKNAP